MNAQAGTGMARALLCEVEQALVRLADADEEAALDLRALPLTQGDREELAQALGQGEVRASVHCAGISEVWETRYRGVWWVRHLGGADGGVLAERIEIARVPQILLADRADIAASHRELAAALEARSAQAPGEPGGEGERHA